MTDETKTDKPAATKVELRISSKVEGYDRFGIKFSRKEKTYDVSHLDDVAMRSLRDDPTLLVAD